MKKIFLSVIFALLSTILLTSCLGSNDDELTYYDDTAITAFTIGDIFSYEQSKTSSGEDTTIRKKITGTNYNFTIDQINHKIYNVDSLPYGTDISKVVCTITTRNGGNVVIKSMTSDSVKYHTSTDSVNFTQPRSFIIYSNSGRYHQEYTISVVAHKQKSDQFVWQRTAVGGAFEGMQEMRAMQLGSRMLVAGSNGTATWFVYSNIDDGQSWRMATPNIKTPIVGDAWQNIVVKDDVAYMLNSNQLLSTTDGEAWALETHTDISRLIGSDGKLLFALSAEGSLLSSADNGQTWNEEQLDDSPSLLPTQDISMVSMPLRTNSDVHRVVLIGNRSVATYPEDAYATVWSKIFEDKSNNPENIWMRYSQSATAPYQAPRQRNLTVVPYAGGMIAVGGYPLGASTAAAFSAMYFSADNGLTWKSDSRFSLPTEFVNVAIRFAMTTDSNHFIWLFSPETGEIWRARLSQLAWES